MNTIEIVGLSQGMDKNGPSMIIIEIIVIITEENLDIAHLTIVTLTKDGLVK